VKHAPPAWTGAHGKGHAAGPMAETTAQNDQICAVQLEIINEPAAAPNGGYVRASPQTAITRSNRAIRYR
jgi:hypothetical protein